MTKLRRGVWGGAHARIEIVGRGATLEFDCAHGEIKTAFVTDREGRFNLPGTYTREGGGPSRIDADQPDGVRPPDEGAETFAARYSGRVGGESMKLTVTLVKTGETAGTFTLGRGRQAILTKCH
jgi:hypothetical protein